MMCYRYRIKEAAINGDEFDVALSTTKSNAATANVTTSDDTTVAAESNNAATDESNAW